MGGQSRVRVPRGSGGVQAPTHVGRSVGLPALVVIGCSLCGATAGTPFYQTPPYTSAANAGFAFDPKVDLGRDDVQDGTLVRLADDSSLRQTMPVGYPLPWEDDYHNKCSPFHAVVPGAADKRAVGTWTGAEAEQAAMLEAAKDGKAAPWPPLMTDAEDPWHVVPTSRHAIVTMAAGDNAGRGAVALVQSLRDVGVCAGIDIVVMLSGGGRGSEDCTKDRIPGFSARPPWKCKEEHPHSPAVVVSQPYIDALKRLGAKVVLIEPVPSATAKIPGGRQVFWGMALNKLRVFGLAAYEKVLWLDSDVFVLKNLDHLLFYPEFTAAFTNDCCNRNSPLRISGGFWVLEPSADRWKHVSTLVNGKDPLVPLNLEHGGNDWHFGDMAVMLALWGRIRKVPPYYKWPEAYDIRQEPSVVNKMYTLERQEQWKPWSEGVVLGSRDDITTLPHRLDEPEEFDFVTHHKDPNLSDRIALDLGLPHLMGRTWHALNASYDWLPVECGCMKDRNRGPGFFFALHFSCMPVGMGKPGHSESYQTQLGTMIKDQEKRMPGCLVDFFRAWNSAYTRAMGADISKLWWSSSKQGDIDKQLEQHGYAGTGVVWGPPLS